MDDLKPWQGQHEINTGVSRNISVARFFLGQWIDKNRVHCSMQNSLCGQIACIKNFFYLRNHWCAPFILPFAK
jgi:hypothetical protein